MARLLFLLAIVLSFVAGYRMLRGLFAGRTFTDPGPRGAGSPRSDDPTAEPKDRTSEAHCRELLGVSETDGEQEIRSAYRSQLTRYHPDKVSHLGVEFQELAAARTREIIRAFDYLRNKHGFS
jgi:DnaJ-domain-containing protein 1